MLIFDIETEPLPLYQIKKLVDPYTPPQPPGEFDPSSVKLGNLKDAAKIEAKIAEARAAHEAEVKGFAASLVTGEADYWQAIIDKAALDARLGRVLAIGYLAADKGGAKDGPKAIDDGKGEESTLIAAFWKKYVACRKPNRKLVGHNITDFDLPFLIRRSWLLSVDVPNTVMANDRFFDPIFVDTRKKWLCGQRDTNCVSSLDAVAKSLGLEGKIEGVCGKDFSRLWREDRAKAEQYLIADLEATAGVASRMGVL